MTSETGARMDNNCKIKTTEDHNHIESDAGGGVMGKVWKVI